MSDKKSIVICSSISFAKEVLEVREQLLDKGYDAEIPQTIQDGEDAVSSGDYKAKTEKMQKHLEKIKNADAVLIVNANKNDISGYIGGNVLIEMGVAFFLEKPIFVMYPIEDTLFCADEVYGLNPTFLNGDVENLTL